MKFETFSIPDGSATLLSWCCKIPKSKRYFYGCQLFSNLARKLFNQWLLARWELTDLKLVFEMMMLLQISFSVSFGLKQRFYPDSIFLLSGIPPWLNSAWTVYTAVWLQRERMFTQYATRGTSPQALPMISLLKISKVNQF